MTMRVVIIGGGIAGTTVAEHLPYFNDQLEIILISATETIKRAVNVVNKGEILQQFDVVDSKPQTESYQFIQDVVLDIDFDKQEVILSSENHVKYDKLCITTGARPKVIFPGITHVYGIRDTESVQSLQDRIKDCAHITVLGNGGIATELVHSVQSCDVTWVIKDDAISSVYVDKVTSKFLLDAYNANKMPENQGISKRHIFTLISNKSQSSSDLFGSALGPDWYRGYAIAGSQDGKNLSIEYDSEIVNISEMKDTSKLKIKLTSGKEFETDALISATGVIPNSKLFENKLSLSAEDGGIIVDKQMRSSVRNVFAAGDVCHIPWKESDNWRQMRLWTQARQQGFYAARCIAADDDDEVSPDISFEIFTHSTKFFGFKVILIGRFREWDGCECYFRITEHQEFIKLVVSNNRVQGAILVGETDLEECFENLILNQLDISHLGESILDPNIDIEEYFD